jgi:hypothetical protein
MDVKWNSTYIDNGSNEYVHQGKIEYHSIFPNEG